MKGYIKKRIGCGMFIARCPKSNSDFKKHVDQLAAYKGKKDNGYSVTGDDSVAGAHPSTDVERTQPGSALTTHNYPNKWTKHI
ncbi:hypothetical protein EVAR_84665_1 [Eumeta japonica]|uniref:Uncharacterized protein n=1 Tax=Eumeta variegata TaxID=151549 RepID=A0A4C1UYI9_EUMVA|nr:hypothetical protein EVAR_84665_1 [Eumeta japonica]